MVKYYYQIGIGNTAHAKLPTYYGDTQKLTKVHCSSVTFLMVVTMYYKKEQLRMASKSHSLIH